MGKKGPLIRCGAGDYQSWATSKTFVFSQSSRPANIESHAAKNRLMPFFSRGIEDYSGRWACG
jgi:hypothetical protein